MDKLRKEFESWVLENMKGFSIERFDPETYVHEEVHHAWMGYKAAKAQSEWVSTTEGTPKYGVPVLLKINDVVQHVTYMRDGADDYCDWFEPYHYEDTNAAVMDNGKCNIEWMPLPKVQAIK